MKQNIRGSRLLILGGFLLCVSFLFAVKLVQYQVVQEEYFDKVAKDNSSYTRKIEATRGEILDRNGIPLATNRMSFNIELNQVFLPKEEINQMVLALVGIMEKHQIPWIDQLPIKLEGETFYLMEDKQEEVDSLLKHLKLNIYATGDNAMAKLIEEYKLEGYGLREQRILGGVRYEMTQRQFSLATPYTFAQDIPMSLVVEIRENGIDLKGVDIVTVPIREYVESTLAPHITGDMGLISGEEYSTLKEKGYGFNDMVGKQGIEKEYEDILRGKKGTKETVRNEGGDIIDVVVSKSPEPGDSVVLTIDKNLQKTSETLLKKYIQEFNATRKIGDGGDASAGSIVVVDVKTGEVLSLATYPSYDLKYYRQNYNQYANDPGKPLLNRALRGLYRPGSTLKPAVALAGTISGFVNPSTTIFCAQKYDRYNQFTCLGYHGSTDINKGMAQSCNIFFYETGYQVGIENLNNTLRGLGMGVKTGIEIGESIGQISSPELSKKYGATWQAGDVMQAAIGQLDTNITPLQMAMYTATIANDGVRKEATLVKEITNYERTQVIAGKKDITAYEFKGQQANIEIVQRAMLETTLSGSGRKAFGSYPFQVATKTGSPQSSSGSNHGTFMAFGPYDDPQIAVVAVIENGAEGYYVSPMVTEVFNAYFFGQHVHE